MLYFIANYEVAGTTPAKLNDLKKWLLKNKLRAIDCETAMSEWVEDRVPISYQFGNKKDQWVIDRRDVSIESLKSLLQDEKSINILHNAKFDYQILKHHESITLESVWDTMLGEQILSTGIDRPKGYFTLEQTHYRYYDSNPYGDQASLFDPYIPKRTRNEISKKTTEPLTLGEIYYAAMDLITAHKIYERQKQILNENKLLETAKLENEFVLVLGDMELNGMPIDQTEWLRLSEWSTTKLKEQESILQKMYPGIANWNSHVQVKKLFKQLGIPIKYQDKESIAETVIKEFKDDYPIISEFLKYKRYQKLSSTYGIKFLDHVNPHTSRIHSNYMQIMSTGRTSSTNPNLQNLPTEKEGFAEGKWWKEAFRTSDNFIIADYSQQEMRLAAHLSGDPELISIFKEDRDPHAEAASALYKVPLTQVSGPQRKNAKTFNFAIIYGTGAYKLSKTFGVSVKEGQQLIDNYYARFSYLKGFQDQNFTEALNNGYVMADTIGRKSYIQEFDRLKALEKLATLDPEYKKDHRKLAGEIFRTSCNYIIQGSAALIAKRAGILMRNVLKTNPGLFKIVLLEHDCWIVESKIDVKAIIETCMRDAALQYCSIEIPAEGLVTSKWSK